MRYEILCFDDFFEVRTYGDAELQGFKDIVQAMLAREDWHTGGPLLINHSELNAAPLTSDQLREIKDFMKLFQSQIGKAKIAIVAPRDLEYGIGRIWKVFASEAGAFVTEVFRSRDEAIFWLKEE
jgi:hypothetical protein